MRRLGVYGDNLPTRREQAVQPADFTIGGLIGFFGRQYEKAFKVNNSIEARAVFGAQYDSGTYGWDALNGFFANLGGERGSLYVLSPKGTSAVQAAKVISTLTIKAAYMNEDAYGSWNNNIGLKITQAKGFEAKLTAAASGAEVVLDSVAGFKVGDQVLYNNVTTTIYTVNVVNANQNKITLSSSLTGALGNTLGVAGYTLQVFVKDRNGLVSEVEQSLGRTLVTLNSNDKDKFISDVFAASRYVKVLSGTPGSTLITDTGIEYLTGGTNGTLPSSDAQYTAYFAAFNGLPIRLAAIAETSNFAVHKAFENYCKNRQDNPIVFYVGAMGITAKAALVQNGHGLQRMDEVDGVYVHNWLKVTDPFSDGGAATRIVPNCGHLMGQWLRSVARNGVHSSPARKNMPLLGVIEPVGFSAQDDLDRTELAEAGVNVIQNISGLGVVLRNLFALSTSPEFKFANAILQRNFIKVSCVDALQISENTPNSIDAVQHDRIAVINFMHRLWQQGSNGNVRVGETFGQYQLADGKLSTEKDAYEVIGDATNNPVADMQQGLRNIDVYFMFPAPAGSIKIGVGLIYKA
jgi:hypothetical protein